MRLPPTVCPGGVLGIYNRRQLCALGGQQKWISIVPVCYARANNTGTITASGTIIITTLLRWQISYQYVPTDCTGTIAGSRHYLLNRRFNPFRTAVSFWGQLGGKRLGVVCPQNGTGVLKGLKGPTTGAYA